ncbi:PRC-barrel domain-containing protein [Pararhizobium gei]|uniref:PRC-barrel domain-containing protein n=1 Tax=Pararhizobium gei TaxID=1395951 RepID=UPI0023DBCEA3|nr:PRC-barrel domain-containing protein [Rhizobium gei]
MNRIFIAFSALAVLSSTTALAQATGSKADPAKQTTDYLSAASDQVLVSSIMGKTVYSGADEEGEAIGNVNDVVIAPSGGAQALVIGVGGFLGIGEKDVAISFDRVTWSNRDGQRIMVVSATKEELQVAPEFERIAPTDGVAAAVPESENKGVTAEPLSSENEQTARPSGGTTPQMTDPEKPPIDPGTTVSNPPPEFVPVDPAAIVAEKMMGVEVKVADDTDLGNIGDVILAKDGKIETYVIDVGGFLGIGEKPVAMSAASVQVLADSNGKMVIYSPFTRAQLENQPAYDAELYKQNPARITLSTPRS